MDDFQAYDRAGGAAYEVHYIVQAPADDIHEFTLRALGYGRDPVLGTDEITLFRGPGRHQAHDGRVFVLGAENRTNALERQGHVDVEVLARTRRKVLRVRVVGSRDRIHVDLERILGLGLCRPVEAIAVALQQNFRDLVHVLVIQTHREGVRLQATTPQIVALGFGDEPGPLGAIDLQRFRRFELPVGETGIEQCHDVFETVDEDRVIAIEDFEGRVEITTPERVVDDIAVLLERRDVLFQEVGALGIQHGEVAVEHRAGKVIVDRATHVMMPRELLDNVDARARMHVQRFERRALRRLDRDRVRGTCSKQRQGYQGTQ